MVWGRGEKHSSDPFRWDKLLTRNVLPYTQFVGDRQGYVGDFPEREFPNYICCWFMSWVYDTELDRDWVPIFQWFQQNKIGCIYPRSVGAHCRVISSDDTKIEGYQPEQSDDRAPQSYAVKPLGYPDLPLPETPFVGAMLLIFGWWGDPRD